MVVVATAAVEEVPAAGTGVVVAPDGAAVVDLVGVVVLSRFLQ